MEDKITINEAYKAMFLYLENLYELTNSDELAGFLGSMATLDDGQPVDKAVWKDWLEAINKAKAKSDISLKLQ